MTCVGVSVLKQVQRRDVICTHIQRLPKTAGIRQHRTALVCRIIERCGALVMKPGRCADSEEYETEEPKAVHTMLRLKSGGGHGPSEERSSKGWCFREVLCLYGYPAGEYDISPSRHTYHMARRSLTRECTIER